MANISKNIEEFILDVLQQESSLQLSRNELANHFSVSPSQINYVLQTRFTFERGYLIESKRGGGGYVNLKKVSLSNNEYFNNIIRLINAGEFTEVKCQHLTVNLIESGYLTKNEGGIIMAILCDKAIKMPFGSDNTVRKNLLTEVIKYIMKNDRGECNE